MINMTFTEWFWSNQLPITTQLWMIPALIFGIMLGLTFSYFIWKKHFSEKYWEAHHRVHSDNEQLARLLSEEKHKK